MSAADSLQKALDAALAHPIDRYIRRLRRQGPKIVRDPLWGFLRLEPYEVALIDSPPFQRLRNIFQTSLALYTYPCAVHSRFEHSLGVAHLAKRTLEAVQSRGHILDPVMSLETKIAALLHDLGHGPFSHSSEVFYGRLPCFDAIRTEQPELFAEASPSEILTYLLITSKAFGHLWAAICDLYSGACAELRKADLGRLASTIVGSDSVVPRDKRFYRQIVNGAFDADKLDYLARDGYFTGLQIALDVERLLHTVKVVVLEAVCELGVVLSGASILEQVLFGKTQLFVTLYHHHKVRAAHRTLLRLLETMERDGYRPAGRSLGDPVSYVLLDDYDLLCEPSAGASDDVRSCVKAIKERDLPRRALVLSPQCFADDVSRLRFGNLEEPDIVEIEGEMAAYLGNRSGWVMLDVPESPRLQQAGQALVELGGDRVVPMAEVFPAAAWSAAYQAYRRVAYVFAWGQDPSVVARAAADVLAGRGVKLAPHAWHLAKLEAPN